ncbi:MAG: hypothetical protein J6A01_02550 [Proteobacteria bacterium]|nr:hypothetical protein [Pseudomonadota bacterium]
MKSSDSKTIICLVCIILGVIIQFLLGPSIITFLVGSLLIAVPPFFLAPGSINPPKKENHSEKPEIRWRTIAKDDIPDTFAHARDKKKGFETYSDFDDTVRKGCLNYVILIGGILLGCAMAFSGEPHSAGVLIDFVLIPWAYIRLKYGKGYRETFKESNSTRTSLRSSNIELKQQNMQDIYDKTSELEPEMEFELTRENGETYLTDVRIKYPVHAKIPGILCSMVSAAVNNYVYPYSYYVLVFKGTQIEDAPIMRELKQRSCSNHFTGDVSVKDGNTVLVITKTSGTLEYATNEDDCEALCRIITDLSQYINSHKDDIAALAV